MVRTRTLLGGLAFALVLGLAMGRAFTEEEEEGGDMGGADMGRAWDDWEKKVSTLGEEHKLLAKHAGQWNVESKFWHGPEPETSTGKATFEMVLGGHHLRQDYTGSMQGKPYSGIGYTSYSIGDQAFQMAWMDGMGTAMITGLGSWDADEKTLTFNGTTTGPSGEYEFRYEEQWISDDEFLFTGYFTMGGQEFKGMELRYKRAGGATAPKPTSPR